MADKTQDPAETPAKKRRGAGVAAGAAAGVKSGRTQAARVIWLVCVLAALALAAGALLVALDANRDNGLVQFVLDVAKAADLGVFSRNNGVFTFDGSNAETKNALLNWGLGAVAWLIVGRIVERIVRP